jgi:large subunit ribosomal protein L20
MARIKNATGRKVRRKKLMKRASGFFGARSRNFRQANEAVMKAKMNAFRGRKERKRQFRRLWIVRINAALTPHNISYSRFIHALNQANVVLDRKALAYLAVSEPEAFNAVVAKAKAALA